LQIIVKFVSFFLVFPHIVVILLVYLLRCQMLLLRIYVFSYQSWKYLRFRNATLSFLLMILEWFIWILIVFSLLVLTRLKIWRALSLLALECMWVHLWFWLRSLFVIRIVIHFIFSWLRLFWWIFIIIKIAYESAFFILNIFFFIIFINLLNLILWMIF